MKAGDTFLRPVRATENEKPHLWIVVTNPNKENQILIVNLTTLKERQDQTVVLDVGDHPFVTKASSIFYREAEIADNTKLEQAERAGAIAKREGCRPEVIKLVRDGVNASPHTRRAIKAFFNDNK